MRIVACMLMLFMLSSCGIFQDNTTPTVNAAVAVERIALDALDTIEELINNSNAPADKKAIVLAKVKAERKKAVDITIAQIRNAESTGTINWKELAKEALELYRMYRNER